jgi:hypothetical protein
VFVRVCAQCLSNACHVSVNATDDSCEDYCSLIYTIPTTTLQPSSNSIHSSSINHAMLEQHIMRLGLRLGKIKS